MDKNYLIKESADQQENIRATLSALRRVISTKAET